MQDGLNGATVCEGASCVTTPQRRLCTLRTACRVIQVGVSLTVCVKKALLSFLYRCVVLNSAAALLVLPALPPFTVGTTHASARLHLKTCCISGFAALPFE